MIYRAAQLAPIVDRVGRMLVDLSPQINNIVKQHHVKMKERYGNSNNSNEPVGIRETINNIISGVTNPQVVQPVSSQGTEESMKPLRIMNQVPIMHAPGEISQVANMFDPRIFEDSLNVQ